MRKLNLSRAALAAAAASLIAAASGSLQAQSVAPTSSYTTSSSSHTSSYDPQIPEPGTWGLIIAGGALLAGQAVARRRKTLRSAG